MERMSLPPGFRFHPTDVELVMYYLKRMVMGMKLLVDAIAELNIYKYSPWDLPDKSCLRSKDLEWYFFCPKERKYASGARTNRATEIGYWKSTGKDRPVLYKQQNVGMVKTLVFHKGHAPSGERTDWVMYEYRLQIKELADAGVAQDAYVLCKVFQKNGRGPKNGAQYGAPFNEEDWDDDAEIRAESLPSSSLCPPALPSNKNDSVVTTVSVHGSTSVDPLSEQGQLNVQPLADGVPSSPPDNDEYMNSLLNMFRDDEVDNCNAIYNGLGNLDWADLIGGECNFTDGTTNYGTNPVLMSNGMAPNTDETTKYGTNPVLMGTDMAPNTDETTKYGTNPVLMGTDMAPNTDETTKYGTNPVLMGNDMAFLELNDLSYPLHYPVEATASEHFSDSLYEPYSDNHPKQSCFPVDSFGAFHHVSDMNQLPMLPEEANGHSNHLDLFQEYDPWENANRGFTASSYNLPSTPCEQPREGNTVVQDQNRGEHQRKYYSRLQQLLESIPARPASAAEHLVFADRAEKLKDPSPFVIYGCSSIDVKAEVTGRVGRCTEDALSQKLEGLPYGCCTCNLPRTGFGKSVVECGRLFGLSTFQGMLSFFTWIFLIAVLAKLGKFTWNVIVSHQFSLPFSVS